METLTIKTTDEMRRAMRIFTEAIHHRQGLCGAPALTVTAIIDAELNVLSSHTHLNRLIQAELAPGIDLTVDIDASVAGFLAQIKRTGIAYQMEVMFKDDDDGDS